MIFKTFCTFAFALVVVLANSSLVYAAKLKVIASTTQIADIARQVAGDRLERRSILAPGAATRTYQQTPDDVQLVLAADLCLENGLHLEGKNWMGTLAKDAAKSLVTVTRGIAPLVINEGHETVPDPHAGFQSKTWRFTPIM